nr:immunoglobulin heavy chain junction region [Mus musculus]
PAQPTWSSAA